MRFIIITLATVLLFLTAMPVNATWYNTTFDKMQPIPINWTGQDRKGRINNYTLFLNISYDSDMMSNFQDLRFINNSDNTLIDYWIENFTVSNFAEIWIEIPKLINSTNTTIDMYYDNSTPVGSVSNGTDTFLFFDDFTEPTLTTGRYTNNTMWLISNSVATSPAGNPASYLSVATFSPPIKYKSRFMKIDTAQIYWSGLGSTLSTGQNDMVGIQQDPAENFYTEVMKDTALTETARGVQTKDVWNKIQIKVNSSMAEYKYNALYWSVTTNVPVDPLQVMAVSWVTGVKYDWVFVANVTEAEPLFSFGVEQIYTPPTGFVQANNVTNGTYPDSKTISCTGSLACFLWMNGTNVTSLNATPFILAAGEWNFTASIPSNQTTVWYVIGMGNVTLSLTGITNHTNNTMDKPIVVSNMSSNLFKNCSGATAFNNTNILLGIGYNIWVGNGSANSNYTSVSTTIEQNITIYVAPAALPKYCQGLDEELDYCQLSDGTKQIILHTGELPSYSVIITL